MAKAILIKDMPVACLTCNGLGRLKGGFFVSDKWYCRFDCMVREIDDNSPYMSFGRPSWCPLIPEPERVDSNDKIYDGLNFADGWNACLDALEGKND